MRSLPIVLVSLLLVGCNKGESSAPPAIVSKVTVLKGLTPTKTIPSVAGEGAMLRYEVKQPFDTVIASVRKDAQAGVWQESAPMGHPVFIVRAPASIANIDVEGGKLSPDGLTLTPDAATTTVTVSEVKTGTTK